MQETKLLLADIKNAHGKVKSGADFPTYIQDLKKMGVTHYDTFVNDGHSDYYSATGQKLTSPSKYAVLKIAETSNKEQFIRNLKAHQKGATDYQRFCLDTANTGITKWTVRIDKMTCTYFDKNETEILVEKIPG